VATIGAFITLASSSIARAQRFATIGPCGPTKPPEARRVANC